MAATAESASAIGTPVMIDDFSGTHGGTRTVTALPLPGESTTAPGTFEESGGLGTMTMTGNGNRAAGVSLSYAMNNVDLTSAGNNTQFFLEFGSIQRLPVQSLGETAASITIQVTDSSGTTGVYNTGISNVIGFNVVLNFNCSPGQTACFSPQPDFTHVTNVTVEVRYPRNIDPVASLTAVIDQIRTTPTGGIAPTAPSPSVIAPESPFYGEIGDTVTFDVAFTSSTGAAAVTNNPPSSTGLRAQDVVTRGTAGGRSNVVVTGGPATYQVTLGPITSTGTLGVDIPAGVVKDVWGQFNTASSNTPTVNFLIAIPPVLDTTNPGPFVIGEPGSFQFEATGLPAPTFEAVGALPAGLTLDEDGTLSGTPDPGTRGNKSVTIQATNRAGNDTHTYTFAINELPMLNAPATVPFEVGAFGTFTVTFDGFPAPSLAAPNRPLWLNRTTNGNGSVTFSGTPPGDAVGDTTLHLTASNAAGSAEQDVTLRVLPAESTTEVSVTPNPAVYGQDTTATAIVSAPIDVAGSVQFSVDGDDVGTPVALVDGEATSPVLTDASDGFLPAGSHTVAANFVPTTVGVLSAEGQVTLVVEKAATTTSVEIQAGKLRATVAALAPGAGEPTGTVTFNVGDDAVDAPLTDGVAEAVYDVASGTEVSAEYSGDDNFLVSVDSTTRTDPKIKAIVSSSEPANRLDWFRTPVTVSFVCEPGSGEILDCPGDVVLTKSDADAVVEGTVHADDGGIASTMARVKLDLDKPKVRIKGVQDGKVYNKPPKPTCVATDAVSGVDRCKLTKTKNGNRVRVTAVATDFAGNSASARANYRIAKPAKPKPIVVRGAEQRGRFFLVDSGRSYALVVRAKNAPRYFFAAPYPQKPYERGPLLDRAGKDRWKIKISVTDAMAARASWNVGVRYGGKLHVVHLRIR